MRTIEPSQMTVGERVEWEKTYDDYSAQDYDLQYRFRGPGPGVDVTATADGAKFVSAITAAQSAKFKPGRYHWQAWLTEQGVATNTFKIAEGRVTVKQGFETGPTGDVELRSVARRIVDCIDEAMLTQTGSTIEYEISTPAGSRRVKTSREDALKTRTYYAQIVAAENARERAAQGGSLVPQIGVRFYDV